MNLIVRALVAAAFMAAPVPAFAEVRGYISGDAGAYLRQASSGSVVVLFHSIAQPDAQAFGTAPRALTFNPGVTAHIAVGAHILRHVRVEGEFGYTGYSSDQFKVIVNLPAGTAINCCIQRGGGGSYLYQRFTEAGNAFYDFSSVLGVTPYLGGGLGIQEYRSRTSSYGSAGGAVVVLGGSGVVGFGQVEAGLTFHASKHLSISPAYRYVRTFGPQSNPSNAFGSGAPNNGDRSGDVAHVVKVGLRYDF